MKEVMILHTVKNIKIIFLVVFFMKLYFLIIIFSKPVVLYRGEDPVYKFIEAILKEYNYCEENYERTF